MSSLDVWLLSYGLLVWNRVRGGLCRKARLPNGSYTQFRYWSNMSEYLGICAAEKLEAAESQMAHSGRMGRYPGSGFERRGAGGAASSSGGDQQLHKIGVDAAKLATEQIKGISSQARSCPLGQCCCCWCMQQCFSLLDAVLKGYVSQMTCSLPSRGLSDARKVPKTSAAILL